jgi:hypothetical protein
MRGYVDIEAGLLKLYLSKRLELLDKVTTLEEEILLLAGWTKQKNGTFTHLKSQCVFTRYEAIKYTVAVLCG